MRSRGGHPGELALTLVALLGGVCIAAFLASSFLGIRPLVFTSGSMSPAIGTGDLAIARTVPAAQLQEGDVVSVVAASGVRVSHRVVDIEPGPSDSVELVLQGDANPLPDSETYRVQQAELVLFHVPRAGYVVAALSGPYGKVATGLLLLVALGQGRRRTPRRRRRAAVATGVAVAVVVAAPGGAQAAFSDVALVSTGQLSAYTVPAPATFSCGGLGVLSVSFSWAAVSGATGYTLHYGSGGASTLTTANTSATITSAISGGTAWVQANRAFGATTWTSVASRTRSYTVAVVSLCS